MKPLILTILFIFSSSAFAGNSDDGQIYSCRVIRMVDYSFFEESLSANEYPDIEFSMKADGEYSLSIGANIPYEKQEGDVVTFTHGAPNKASTTEVRTQNNDHLTLEIEYRSELARAVLKVREAQSSKSNTLAYLICNKGFL